MDAVAKLSGVSRSMVSQIERGESSPTVATLWNLTQALQAEHRQLESRWAALREKLEVVAEAEALLLAPEEVTAFVKAYRNHILKEDTELLPMAARLLGEEALKGIGQAMRARRGF